MATTLAVVVVVVGIGVGYDGGFGGIGGFPIAASRLAVCPNWYRSRGMVRDGNKK